MNYWLFKTEPDVFSIEDLKNSRNQTANWEGIRNYQARNNLRDLVKLNDQVLIYHSSIKIPAVVGIASVVKEAYPDKFAFDKNSKYFDPKSKPENPTWVMVDVKFLKKLEKEVTLDQIKSVKTLQNMKLLTHSRLSIQPLTAQEFKIILKMGN